MKLPQMVSNVTKSKKYVVEFGGINKSSRFREGELADCKNLSSDLLPCISQRGQREQIGEFISPTAIHAHNGIAIVDGTSFLYRTADGKDFEEKFQVQKGEKQLVQNNNAILVCPDMIAYDVSTGEKVVLDAAATLIGREWSNEQTSINYWTRVYYHFTHIYHNKLVLYDITEAKKISHNSKGAKPYEVNLFAKEVYEKFTVGDIIRSIKVTGYHYRTEQAVNVKVENVVIKEIIRDDSVSTTTLIFENGTFFDKSDSGYLVIDSNITITKDTPPFEYVCTANGRVWGCCENKIYASAYNDPKRYEQFEGLSTDSYTIEASTAGDFTGCAAFTSHIVFFKEDSIHRIYGSRPSNFNMVVSGAPGVQKGSYNSVKMLNEKLFYKGVDGIYMYSGGMPVLISGELGAEAYTNAVAGVQGNKYYISMKNSEGEYELFSYDTLRNVFLKEDNTQFVDTTQKDGKLLFIDADGRLMAIGVNRDVDGIEWSAELREFNETVNEKKGYSRIILRIELDPQSYMKAEVAMDNGRFEQVKTVNRPGKNIVNINIPPNRCDSFKLRLSGVGRCRVMNMVREFIMGNEVR